MRGELDLDLPKPNLILWPRAAIDAFVSIADESGHTSIGDAIVMMGWLGVRKQDWLSWPADVFDRDLLAFRQEETSNPPVLPWQLVPALVQRVTAARERRQANGVAATTFFHDPAGRPWNDADGFRDAFNELRQPPRQDARNLRDALLRRPRSQGRSETADKQTNNARCGTLASH